MKKFKVHSREICKLCTASWDRSRISTPFRWSKKSFKNSSLHNFSIMFAIFKRDSNRCFQFRELLFAPVWWFQLYFLFPFKFGSQMRHWNIFICSLLNVEWIIEILWICLFSYFLITNQFRKNDTKLCFIDDIILKLLLFFEFFVLLLGLRKCRKCNEITARLKLFFSFLLFCLFISHTRHSQDNLFIAIISLQELTFKLYIFYGRKKQTKARFNLWTIRHERDGATEGKTKSFWWNRTLKIKTLKHCKALQNVQQVVVLNKTLRSCCVELSKASKVIVVWNIKRTFY